jgi:hypothetical protein
MSFRGKPIRAAIGSSFMVENAKDNPFAGAALLKAFLSGPQELSITDSANSISEALMKKLGGQLLPLRACNGCGCFVQRGLLFSAINPR